MIIIIIIIIMIIIIITNENKYDKRKRIYRPINAASSLKNGLLVFGFNGSNNVLYSNYFDIITKTDRLPNRTQNRSAPQPVAVHSHSPTNASATHSCHHRLQN